MEAMKTRYLLMGILIGIISFPTITLGGSFVSSLIDGKTVEESVQILGEQIDTVIGRVGMLESRADKEEACRKADRLFFTLPPHSGGNIGRLGGYNNIVDLYNATVKVIEECKSRESGRCSGDPRDLPIVEQYYQDYLSAKVKCE